MLSHAHLPTNDLKAAAPLKIQLNQAASLAAASANRCVALLVDSTSPETQELCTLRLRQLVRAHDRELANELLLGAITGVCLTILKTPTESTAIELYEQDDRRQLRSEVRLLLREIGSSSSLLSTLGNDHCERIFGQLVANIDSVANPFRPFVESIARLYAPSRLRSLSEESLDAFSGANSKRLISPNVIDQIIAATKFSELLEHLSLEQSPAHLEWALLRTRQLFRTRAPVEEATLWSLTQKLLGACGVRAEEISTAGRDTELDVGVAFDALETLRRMGLAGYSLQLTPEHRAALQSHAANLIYSIPNDLKRFSDEVACRV